MPSLLPRSGLLVATGLALLLLPPLVGSQQGCKCKRDTPDPDYEELDERQQIDLERKLQISRIVPDVVPPNEPFTADVLGAGIQGGAKVKAGLTEARGVAVHSSTRLTVNMPPMQVGEYDLTVTNPDGEVVTLRRALLVRVRPSQAIRCDPVTVYFEFDRDTVTAQGRDALDTVAPCLAEVQGRVRLEGHTDERGSTDYNLALGQRRADAVHRYLVGQAVPLNRLRTVSYGEERPVDPASNERAWALNRRVEVVVEDR